jgi:hypothetical protein
MSSIIWDRDVAEVYDQTYRAKFEASVLDPIVDLLAGWPEAAQCSSSPSAPGGWRCR